MLSVCEVRFCLRASLGNFSFSFFVVVVVVVVVLLLFRFIVLRLSHLRCFSALLLLLLPSSLLLPLLLFTPSPLFGSPSLSHTLHLWFVFLLCFAHPNLSSFDEKSSREHAKWKYDAKIFLQLFYAPNAGHLIMSWSLLLSKFEIENKTHFQTTATTKKCPTKSKKSQP